jgi:tetratricopeptide (TPR) repeat protein
MTILPGIALYNQARQRDDDFVESFVARRDLLELLLNVLRKMAREGGSEHQLLVGQRGMGKSMLLRRVALGIKQDEELRAHFLPLQFREEQYNVNTLDVFWRNCGDSLAQWSDEDERHEIARRLDEAIESPEWRDSEKAADAFLGACKEIGRRPALFVDNLDLIVDALKPVEQWALRRALQAPQGPILIGAATHFLAQSGDREAAFYEFFHPHVLEPLTEGELMQCMRSLADRRGEAGAPIRQILEHEPERLRTLYDLTGGNPRVLALIYQLLERRESGEVFADLEALLDQVSPYYKARVEEYATPQQRSVIDAIALNWDPITSHDLSLKAGIEITTTSSQLNRMKKDGFVEEVPTSGTRSGYQLAERFLNIWYLMRHGTRRTKQRLLWLAKFLSKLYGAEELGRMALEARSDVISCAWRPEYREAVIAAYEESRLTPSFALSSRNVERKNEKFTDRTAIATTAKDPRSQAMQPSHDVSAIVTLTKRAKELDAMGDFVGAIKVLDEVVARFGASSEPALLKAVARALVFKGIDLGELGRREDAIAAYDDVVARFGASTESALREQVVRALVNKGIDLGELGRREGAIGVCDEVVARFGASSEPALLEGVARALVNKGIDLGELGRREDAITAFDEVVTRFGASSEPALREQVAMALVDKGIDLRELGRREDAIAAYDDVVARFGTSSEPALLEWVARALVDKGDNLGQLGRRKDAIEAYDEVVTRFGASSEPALFEWVARALVNKSYNLGELGRREGAIGACDEVMARFGASTELVLREGVTIAQVNKGDNLGALDRREEAIAVYDNFLARSGASTEPALLKEIARALVNKGYILGQLGRREEAIEVYDEVVARFSASPGPALLEPVAWALVNKGYDLGELGRREDAIAACDEVAARFGASSEPVPREAVHNALCNKGSLLFDCLGDLEGAELAYRNALKAAAPSAIARANLAWLLLTTARVEEARVLRAQLTDLAPVGGTLLDAGLELAGDNFGAAAEHLGKALDAGLTAIEAGFFDDLLRFLRLAEARGYGDRLIAWFESSGNADKYAPAHAAFVAYVRGERFLLDVNPEVRRPAREIFDKLTARRRNARRDERPAKPAPARRGGRKLRG